MYYYIFEPPQGPKEYERTAQIKELLAELAIAGEMSAPQPGKSVEDLVGIAISKRYSTIVAVGGMELVNRVARAILHYDVVMGIIPTHSDPDITELIGTSDWREAANHLKRRRWQPLRLGTMNRRVSFLTPASIAIPPKDTFTITAPEYALSGTGPAFIKVIPSHQEEASAGFYLQISQEEKRGGLLSMFMKQESQNESAFWMDELSIQSPKPHPVVVAGETLAETPVECTTESKTIRLIVGRPAAQTEK